jgi:hypothetical protein
MTFGLSASESPQSWHCAVPSLHWQLHPCRCPAPTQTVLVAGTESPLYWPVRSGCDRWLRAKQLADMPSSSAKAPTPLNHTSPIPSLLYLCYTAETCRLSLLHVANSCCWFFWVHSCCICLPCVSSSKISAGAIVQRPRQPLSAPLPSSCPACYTACALPPHNQLSVDAARWSWPTARRCALEFNCLTSIRQLILPGNFIELYIMLP